MPPSFTSTLKSDTWNGNVDRPFDSGTQVRHWVHALGNVFVLDDLIAASHSLGDVVNSTGGVVTARGWVTNITLEQLSTTLVRESITWSNELQFSSAWGSTSAQSVVPTAPGYVNVDVRDIQTSATWWKYADADFWGTPWETDTPSNADQDTLRENTTKVCDLAGVPMTAPLPQEEMVIQTTWESASSASTFRTRWRGQRHSRNNATFLGYPKGTLIFVGASTRVATGGEMPVSDLRFIYDSYGHLRQRAVSDNNGQYTDDFLMDVTPPGTDPEDFSTHRHAEYVYWVQLHQSMTDFDSLLQTSQLTKAATLIT